MYALWITVFWTFSKDGSDILIVCDAHTPRNDMINGTIFEWRIVVGTIRRFSFEVINTDVLQ
jgi:hypothetical protein